MTYTTLTMSPLSITLYPAKVLLKPTTKVGAITPAITKLIDAMIEAMHRAEGVGLAATQVSRGIRLCVLEHRPTRDDPREAVPLQVLINPKIISRSREEEIADEGCLSLPNVEVSVSRAVKVKVKAQDRDGQPIQFRASGFHARIIQHELDHLDGRLIAHHARKPEKVFEEFLSKDKKHSL